MLISQKIILSISIIFLIINNQYRDNQKCIKEIKQLPFSEIVYGIKQDTNGQFTDTVYIEKRKYYPTDILAYKYIIDRTEMVGFYSEEYYRKDQNLFLQTRNFQNDIFNSTYETFIDSNNLIQQALMISGSMDRPDTMSMSYERYYASDGQLESLRIRSQIANMTTESITQYNKEELPASSYALSPMSDTTYLTKYFYQNRQLVRLENELLISGVLSISHYDAQEYLVREQLFQHASDSLILLQETDYTRNNKGDILLKSTNNLADQSEEKMKYIYEKRSF